MRSPYQKTMYACFIGYIVQAVVNNFVPLLFVTFQKTYQISLSKITFLITINFLIQLLVDMLSAGFVDKIGYRASIILAHVCAAGGLLSLTILPELLQRHSDRCGNLRCRRRTDRGIDQPDSGSLSHGQQGTSHEFAPLLLLLGAYGRGTAFHSVLCPVRY